MDRLLLLLIEKVPPIEHQLEVSGFQPTTVLVCFGDTDNSTDHSSHQLIAVEL